MKVIHQSVVIIPLYKEALNETETFSFNRTLEILYQHPVIIICPESLAQNFNQQKLGWPHPNINIQSFANTFFLGIAGYNRLLKSRFFYESFKQFEYMLLVQTDALIITDQLIDWCQKGYSYIGAPFFVGFANPSRPLTFFGVGNGGISLRRIPDFIKAASPLLYIPNTLALKPKSLFDSFGIFRFIKHRILFSLNRWPLFPRINEDVYWGVLIPRYFSFFKVPKPEEALQFAFDAEPRYLFELNQHQLPFACHAWEKFDISFWREILLQQGITLPLEK